MQGLEELRTRAGAVATRGAWFRIGAISATAVAPLIARWNQLRAASRATALRQQAEGRLDEARTLWGERGAPVARRLSDQAAPVARRLSDQVVQAAQAAQFARVQQTTRNRVRVGLWLAGVSVGLVAAGVGAYAIARRRMASTEDETLVELQMSSVLYGTPTDENESTSSRAGALLTMDTADDYPTHMPGWAGLNDAELVEPGMPEPGEPLTGQTPPSTDGVQAPYVGNIHTMIYHDGSDTEHLPGEDNRVYFATEQEARAAGYRRNRQEIAAMQHDEAERVSHGESQG